MQVRKRPLNKKELAKNEEDIVETTANYLTVHETKLKASFATYCFHKLLNCNAVIIFVLLFWLSRWTLQNTWRSMSLSLMQC